MIMMMMWYIIQIKEDLDVGTRIKQETNTTSKYLIT